MKVSCMFPYLKAIAFLQSPFIMSVCDFLDNFAFSCFFSHCFMSGTAPILLKIHAKPAAAKPSTCDFESFMLELSNCFHYPLATDADYML